MRCLLLTLGLLISITPAVTAVDKADEIVAVAIEAHGGLAILKKYPAGASKISGKILVDGREYPLTGSLAFMIPTRVRMEMTIDSLGQKSKLLQVVNGLKVNQTENGSISKLDEPVKAELRESAVSQEMSLLYPLLDPTKYTLAMEMDTTLDGKKASVVIARSRGLKDTKLYFDRNTGLLMATLRKGLDPAQKAVDELTLFSDYKSINGLVVPMASKVFHNGKPFLILKVSEYKPLEKIDEKLFEIE